MGELDTDPPVSHGGDAEIAPGTMIGEYRIEGLLGEGGMGRVYSAVHPVIAKRAAVKVLHPALSVDKDAVERFVLEARSVNQIGHPNIVDIFAFGTMADGRSYFVMEWLRGESLRARLARAWLPLTDSLAILDTVSVALEAAHEKGIVHRDLKPDNIFLVDIKGAAPQVKLLDFGIAKLVGSDGPQSQRTRTGNMLGTPAYMSPEQARGYAVDHRTDLYAFGAVAFELVTGRLPYPADNSADMIAKHLFEEPPDAHEVIPEVPPELGALIAQLLAKEPAQRPLLSFARDALRRIRTRASYEMIAGPQGMMYPTGPATDPVISAVHTEVRAYNTPRPRLATPAHGLAVASTVLQETADLPPPRSRRWLIALVATGVAGLAIALIVAFSGGRHDEPKPVTVETPVTKPVEPAAPPPRARRDEAGGATAGRADGRRDQADRTQANHREEAREAAPEEAGQAGQARRRRRQRADVMTRFAWIALGIVAGCYRPSVRPCQFACDGDLCPSGLTCNSAGMCVAKVGDTCGDAAIDAPVIGIDSMFDSHLFDGPTIDVPMIDAMVDAPMIDAMVDAPMIDAMVDAPMIDAMIDGPIIDAPQPDAPGCSFPASNVDACALGAANVTGDLVVTNSVITTNTAGSITISTGVPSGTSSANVTLANGVPAAVLMVRSFTVMSGGTVTVNGPRPLIILANSFISISGTIDVQPVDASALPLCMPVGGGGGQNGGELTGGGGGASFGDNVGSTGGGGKNGAPPGGGPGTKDAVISLDPLRPGCPGGQGGNLATAMGNGGLGGGAIQLSTNGTISVSGQIAAPGHGGASALALGGAGGGGSGGAILVEGPMVFLTGAMLCANGGGGGQSGQTNVADDGKCASVAAIGAGAQTGQSGRGGNGAFINVDATPGADGSSSNGGGGAGGGVGRIRVNGFHTGTPGIESPMITFGFIPP